MLSNRVQKVKPSATITISAKAMELRANGIDVISLSAGEPDFDTPEHIKKAAIEAINKGQTKYTQVDGTPELKDAIINKFNRDNNLHYQRDNIIVSTGAKQTLYNLFQSVLEADDEVVIISPYWVSYPDMVILADANPVIMKTHQEDNFEIDMDSFRAALTDKTKLLILNSPSNPTGITYTKAQYKSMGKILSDYPNVLIATDDMYEHIYWGNEPFTSFAEVCPNLFDRTITINGVSKAYAMTGWRIGYCGAPKTIVQAMKKIQGQSTSNPSSISQVAAIAALNGPHDAVNMMVNEYKKRHDYLCDALNKINGFNTSPGTGAFYLFPDVNNVIESKGFADDIEFSSFLIDQANVAVIPGSAFGAEGCIRISYATSMELLKESIARIKLSLE
ncbi:MAG TPA: pyridoxal phosphate-dependent aminotransferase [Gammaproteobacteria bacterium]|jgi:aspartate aminotransferase|nr:pyridoxal phosphate-dependent aminotransferase [Gammaproteobacteria bacterium]HIK76955.1 pyridoxal phosphate-dependent aminotransferase [Gammaproteobacteria bacterium]